jgi:hypothetical protein
VSDEHHSDAVLDAFNAADRKDIAALQSIGLLPADECEKEPDHERPDFDGGPRESANESVDLEADHNALVVEALQDAKWRAQGA